MYCNECGTQNKDGAKFCSKCGERLPLPDNSETVAAKPEPVISSTNKYSRKTQRLGLMNSDIGMTERKKKKLINLQLQEGSKAVLTGTYYSFNKNELSGPGKSYYKGVMIDVYSSPRKSKLKKESSAKSIDLNSISDVYYVLPSAKKNDIRAFLRVIGILLMLISVVLLMLDFVDWAWVLLVPAIPFFVVSFFFVQKRYTAISTPQGDFTVGGEKMISYVEDMIEDAH